MSLLTKVLGKTANFVTPRLTKAGLIVGSAGIASYLLDQNRIQKESYYGQDYVQQSPGSSRYTTLQNLTAVGKAWGYTGALIFNQTTPVGIVSGLTKSFTKRLANRKLASPRIGRLASMYKYAKQFPSKHPFMSTNLATGAVVGAAYGAAMTPYVQNKVLSRPSYTEGKITWAGMRKPAGRLNYSTAGLVQGLHRNR
jgi:hypothetical protein